MNHLAMDSCLLSFLAFSCLVGLAGCHGDEVALPGQVYWDAKLPNTPMPGAIRDILYPTPPKDEKVRQRVSAANSSHVTVSAPRDGNTGSTHVSVSSGSSSNDTGSSGTGSTGAGSPSTSGGVDSSSSDPTIAPPPPATVYVHVNPYYYPYYYPYYWSNPFNYNYGAADDQLHDDPSAALFFLEKDLRPGTSMTLRFTRSSTRSTSAAYTNFLPRGAADAVPFSSKKLPEVLAKFSIDPASVQARLASKTLRECEEPAEEGVTAKKCVTSLESMVDFATSTLSTNKVTAASTRVIGGAGRDRRRPYIIKTVSNIVGRDSSKVAVCHYQPYVYAVFYCHVTGNTSAYVVRMTAISEGHDDVVAAAARAEAVAVCHEDTSKWNPRHLAFRVLKVKPGEAAVCHFLPQDHVIWAPLTTARSGP